MDRKDEDQTTPGAVDADQLAKNIAYLIEQSGKAMAAYLKPREAGENRDNAVGEIADVVKTLGQVAEYWISDPKRTLEAQSSLVKGYMELWSQTMRRLSGETTTPVAKPGDKDKRFVDPEWSENPFFDTVKQAYLITVNWAERMVREAESLNEHTKHKADFYVRQLAGGISPSNFVLTNPELFRETLGSNAGNLVRGMKMLTEDIEAGRGDLKIRQSDASQFEVGK
ncbi:MAG TPA: class I poly(R)-hydroxyalkanoic acid synthase, partial [Xanthobacteraceae bacterium]|nr:class I poly(R)-hydroxyalkanoic acid synthase [Xanthobacteraceae bacterium]